MKDSLVMADEPKPVGRPTKYKPEFCDMVIEFGKTGASKAEMALDLDIAMSTFDVWQNDIPEFMEAVKRAVSYSQGYWEKQGRLATFGGVQGFNPTSFIFNMKNRFKEDWRDVVKNEMTGKDGNPIQTESCLNDTDRDIIQRYLTQTGAKK